MIAESLLGEFEFVQVEEDEPLRSNGYNGDEKVNAHKLFDEMPQRGYEGNEKVNNARKVFDECPKEATMTTSLVCFMAMQRRHSELFADRISKGFRSCEVTYIGVLTACTHAGFVDEGLQHFENMQKVHQIEPTAKHNGCVVDLLSRAGLLDKAYEFLKNLPIDLEAMAWRILLNACRLYGNVVLAEIVSNKLWELDPSNSGNYVLLSNTYAGLDRWVDAGTTRKLMKVGDVQKAHLDGAQLKWSLKTV